MLNIAICCGRCDRKLCTHLSFFAVSYTTDDLVFVWEKITPLVVDENIELPQLDLVNNYTADCTHVYPTGQSAATDRACLAAQALRIFRHAALSTTHSFQLMIEQ